MAQAFKAADGVFAEAARLLGQFKIGLLKVGAASAHHAPKAQEKPPAA